MFKYMYMYWQVKKMLSLIVSGVISWDIADVLTLFPSIGRGVKRYELSAHDVACHCYMGEQEHMKLGK